MIHANLQIRLKAPLCHLSGEQHVWHEDGNLRKKRVVRLHMRKRIHYPSPDGTQQVTVPIYQGNSWRGLLRYHLGLHVLDQLQDQGVPITKDLFSTFLASGGLLKSKQDHKTHDLDTFYAQYPTYWLLGGTFHGKLYRGHSAIGDWIPVCHEGISNRTIPDALADHALTLSEHRGDEAYRTPLTTISMVTRRDPKLRPDLLALVDDAELAEMLNEYQKDKATRTKAKMPKPETTAADAEPHDDTDKVAAEQQIIATETVIEGTTLFGQMSILDGEGPHTRWARFETVGFGCLLLAIERFSRTPFIGGGYRQGFGRIDLKMDVAFGPDRLVQNAVELTHVNGFPLFTLHPDLHRFRKAADEAMADMITRIKQESR